MGNAVALTGTLAADGNTLRRTIRRRDPRCVYEFTSGTSYWRCVLNDGHAERHLYDASEDWEWWKMPATKERA